MHVRSKIFLLLLFITSLVGAQNEALKEPYAYIPGVLYTQGFEGAGFPPPKWQIKNVTGTAETWKRTNGARTGNYAMFMQEQGQDEEDYLILPKYTPVSGDSLIFYIKPYFDNTYGDFLEVLASSSTTSFTYAAVLMEKTELITLDTKWKRIAISLDNIGSSYIVFKYSTTVGAGSGVYIDDLSIGQENPKTAGTAWFAEKPLPAGRSAQGAAFYTDINSNTPNGTMFVISGASGKDPKKDAAESVSYKYDVYTKEWSQFITEIPAKYISAEQLKGKLYVAGGLTDGANGVYDQTRIYDIRNNTWRTPNYHMSYELSDYVSGTYLSSDRNYYTYTVTGTGETGVSSSGQLFNINTDEFNTFSYSGISPTARTGARGGIVGDKIILVGGIVDGKVTDEVVIGTIKTGLYNYPTTINWSAAGHYPGGKVTGVNAGVWNGADNQYLIFTGGDSTTNGTGLLKSTWVYDGVNSKWIEGPDRKTALSYGAVTSIVRNDSVYFAAVGGLTAAGSQTNNEWLFIGKDKAPIPAGKDIALSSIDMPDAMPSVEITPKATFVNVLADTQDVWVQLEIQPGNFKYGHWVNKVPYGKPMQTDFPKWYPTKGTYTVKIYTRLLNDADEYAENDTLFKTVTVSGNDLAVSKLYDQPLVLVQTEISPKAQFVNISGAKKTFTATMKVMPGDYSCVKTIEQLATGDTVDIDFDKWTPAAGGVYHVKVYTTFAGDDNKLNDTLTSVIHISPSDVKPLEFTFPTQMMATKEYAPKASFLNTAQLGQSFTVTMKITPGDYTCAKTIENLGPMKKAEVEFEKWIPAGPGNYSVSVFTSLDIDDNKGNDRIDTAVSVIPFAYDRNHAMTELILPKPYLVNTPVTPKVKITNQGMLDPFVTVRVKIQPGNYSSVRSLMYSIKPGDTTTVAMNDAWTPLATGTYNLVAYVTTSGGDEYKYNDTIKTVLVVNAADDNADIAVSKVNAPSPISINHENPMSADFVNNGQVTQTSEVTMMIFPGEYVSVKSLVDAAPQTTATVDFDPWIPTVSGSYTVKVYSSLDFDKNKANDTLTTTIIIEKSDIAAYTLDVKKLTELNETITPKAGFINNGKQALSFKAVMNVTPGDYKSEVTITNLAGLDTTDVEFTAWTPTETGVYTVKVFSSYSEDESKLNDTLAAKIYVLKAAVAGEWFTETPAPVTATVKTSVAYTKKAVVKGEKDKSYIFVITYNPDTTSGNTTTYYSSVYDVNAKKWNTASALPGYLENFKPVYAEGKIYVAGGLCVPNGEYATQGSDKLFIYDTETDKWSVGPPMIKSAADYAVGQYNDSLIYVIGGYNKTAGVTSYLNKVQIYNIKNGSWKEGTEYTGKFYPAHSGSILKNKIVIVGGVDFKSGAQEAHDQVVVGEIDTLNPYSITWKAHSYPAGTAYGVAAVKYEGKSGSYIAFAGGSQEKLNLLIYCSSTLAYDPEKDEWLKLPDAKIPTYFGSGNTVVRNDSVYFNIIGGHNKSSIKGLNQWLYLGEAIKDTTTTPPIGIDDELQGPAVYALSQNYPNPFNPSTVIKYSVAEAGHVELKVYDLLGQEVMTLVNEFKSSGRYNVRFDAAGLNLASGIYLYRIQSGSFVQTKKLILIK